MKQAISLVEVLVSIVLLSTVIVASLQMKNNTLFFLEQFPQKSLYNSYLSIAVKDGQNRNDTFYLDQKTNFRDDDIRKILKQIKITIKDKQLKNIQIVENKYIESIGVIESSYSVKNQDKMMHTKLYTFTLEP